ncbi:TlpA disulfide reductase family protein [uncultured Nocardioides sp.]|uniref:TlpA family protein disulfide reductase n=1 Tax=uncultured Nocardioides sp. TaxID=198441 RepID=UPI002639D007|nr:TlpA disulfide reductase family protein [uncultured Nocardioides sp.]
MSVSACSSGGDRDWTLPFTGPPEVQVDTPELREAKERAGIEPCPAPEPDGGRTPGGDRLPEVVPECFGGGRAVDLSTLRGPRVISVWAQWCEACATEVPVLQDFHDEHGERVPVLGIDYQDPQADRAMDFLAAAGATYPQLSDPAGDINALDPIPFLNKLPLLMVIDASGRVVDRRFVVIESVEQLEDIVSDVLPGPGPTAPAGVKHQ